MFWILLADCLLTWAPNPDPYVFWNLYWFLEPKPKHHKFEMHTVCSLLNKIELCVTIWIETRLNRHFSSSLILFTLRFIRISSLMICYLAFSLKLTWIRLILLLIWNHCWIRLLRSELILRYWYISIILSSYLDSLRKARIHNRFVYCILSYYNIWVLHNKAVALSHIQFEQRLSRGKVPRL